MIPAYRQGVMYFDGKPRASGDDPVDRINSIRRSV